MTFLFDVAVVKCHDVANISHDINPTNSHIMKRINYKSNHFLQSN